MQTTIEYQTFTKSLVSVWWHGHLMQTISYDIRGHQAKVLNLQYYLED